MTEPVVYRYDGSFDGFLCCVFESVSRKEIPVMILPAEDEQATLYPERWIETQEDHARRVEASFPKKMSPQAARFIKEGFLTCLPEKESALLRFIRQGYRYGGSVLSRLTDESVYPLHRAVKNLHNEAHCFLEFLRFSEYRGAWGPEGSPDAGEDQALLPAPPERTVLAAVIEPKSQVLPLLAPHFCDRYPEETFLIADKTHGQVLYYHPYRPQILTASDFTLPDPGEEEAQFRQWWKTFVRAIAIRERRNPRCQRTHLPLWYRENMTEFL